VAVALTRQLAGYDQQPRLIDTDFGQIAPARLSAVDSPSQRLAKHAERGRTGG
jgi:hypothetical protein